jgi:hypothetical protein
MDAGLDLGGKEDGRDFLYVHSEVPFLEKLGLRVFFLPSNVV